jgi:hypothetical protein
VPALQGDEHGQDNNMPDVGQDRTKSRMCILCGAVIDVDRCRFKLTRSEAEVDIEKTWDVSGELEPALRIKITPEVPFWVNQEPDIIHIITNKHGLKTIKLNNEFLYNGATRGTITYIEMMTQCYIEYLLHDKPLEEASTLNKYLALLMMEAHRKIFAVSNIVNELVKPPKLLRLITFFKYVKLKLSVALFNIKNYILKGKGVEHDPRAVYEMYMRHWIRRHRE